MEREFNKFICYAIGLIILYYVLTVCIQFVIYGVVGLLLFRVVFHLNRK